MFWEVGAGVSDFDELLQTMNGLQAGLRRAALTPVPLSTTRGIDGSMAVVWAEGRGCRRSRWLR